MRWLRACWTHPGWMMFGLLAWTLFCLLQLVDVRTGRIRLQIDPSADRLLPEGGEERQLYDRARRLFGSDEAIVIALNGDDVFTPSALERLQRLTGLLENAEGVQRVISLANVLDVKGVDGDLRIGPFYESVPREPEALEDLRQAVLSNPIYGGNLVSEDSKTTALLVYLQRLSDRELIESRIPQHIADLARREAGAGEVWVSGMPYLKAAISDITLAEMTFTLPITLAVLAFVLLLSLGTLRGALVPLATLAVALVWTLGTLCLFGQSLTLVTTVVPVLILTVGFSYVLYSAADYFACFDGENPAANSREAVREMLGRVAVPLFATGLTTAAGFLSLVVHPIPAIREFGLFSLLGVGYAAIATLLFTSTAFALMGTPRRRPTRGLAGPLHRLAGALGDMQARRLRLPFVVWSVVFLVGVLGGTRVRVATEMMDFDPQAPIRRDYEAINRTLRGANEIQVLIESDVPDAFVAPNNLQTVQDLQDWLESQPEIGITASIVDYLTLLNRALHDGDPAFFEIPETQRLASQILIFGASAETQRLVDARNQVANVRVRANVVDSDAVSRLLARIERRLEELPEHLRGRVTGSLAVLSTTIDDVARGQISSLFTALVLVYGLLALTFMSLRVGAVAMIPNVVPLAAFFGALGFADVPLNSTTSLVGPIVLGIAVDDTIHLFSRFNANARRLADEGRAATETLRELIQPVTYTTLGLCLGFLVLTLSDSNPLRQFGFLAAFTLAVAWLTDVTLTPALCSRIRIVTLWDVLNLDLGQHPQKTIPLFTDLSDRQARIVALTMDMLHVSSGTRLMREGAVPETEHDMYVVLDGQLSCSVLRDGRRVELSKLGRGDTVGEVGYMGGERSADVDAVTDVRMLRFDSKDLEWLRRNHPRAAALVYRNLNLIQAQRLVRTTARVR